LAQRIEKLSSELLLICRGEIISSHPNSSLESFGLAVGGAYQLLVIVTRAWLRVTAHILCSSFPPMPLPMCASSHVADVKHELRDLLRIPNLCLSLHLADGEPLPDGASLRDLGVRDGERVYCRIHTEDPPPAAAVDAGRVREQIRRAEAAGTGLGRFRASLSPQRSDSESLGAAGGGPGAAGTAGEIWGRKGQILIDFSADVRPARALRVEFPEIRVRCAAATGADGASSWRGGGPLQARARAVSGRPSRG
jgi:hypothetical protein